MDEYAGRVLAERYRLPLRPAGDDDFAETRAFDTYSGQEVLVRQVPLPEVVDAEMLDAGAADAAFAGSGAGVRGAAPGAADRNPRDPAVRRAWEAATAAAALPDHPGLDQVFDVFTQHGSLWIAGELLAARPLSALLAERALSPHRAAEIAADVLAALRALHAHGWLHRNITARTVLVCDDGRAILTGLAVGAAQEALCGYDVVPGEEGSPVPPPPRQVAREEGEFSPYGDHIGDGDGEGDGGGDDGPVECEGEDEDEGEEAVPAEGEGSAAYGRPSAGLAAERARQARLNTVGPVTERWAPEQAGTVHEKWQLAPPVGPATDLWAVGALLFRGVQGHPPYPEESAAELAQLVCARQPAPAEECGALRPVVESLLRQDPAERPGIEELRGWLRSLIRMAPEPELGSGVVTVPALEQGADPRRLPIVRRRGELVRRGRHKRSRSRRERHPATAPQAAAPTSTPAPTGPVAPPPSVPMPPQRLPKQPKPLRQPKPSGAAAPPEPVRLAKAPRTRRVRPDEPYDQVREEQLPGHVGVGPEPDFARGARTARRPGAARGPRHLGRLLLGLVLLLLVAAVVFAVAFLPKNGADSESGRSGDGRTGTSGGAASPAPSPGGDDDGQDDGKGSGSDGGRGGDPQTSAPAGLAKGFVVRSDPKGFQVAVRKEWQRRGANDRGQVRYVGGDYELVIVPGRDTTKRFGADPMAYQQDREPELAPYRDSSWSSSSGLRRIDVGKTAMAEGTFTWRDGSGREVYVRNLAMIHNGRYHLVQVIGPDNDRREIDHLYEQATDSYRPN